MDQAKSSDQNGDFKVTPWEVEGAVDYDKLIEKFGTQPITPEILQKVKGMTGEIHPMLKLRYFFSHRDFDRILDKKSKGENFYLYTGRGPSGMVHMGHLMPWMFTKSTNIGMIGFPPVQAAPCFLPSVIEGKPVPVLIPAAIDQDPYWRITRDVADRMGYYKPAQIHSKFLPGLGMLGKMSSSKPETAIFTTDDPEVVEKKVSTAFTGGQPTIALQRQLGANAPGCPVFLYLRYFFDTEGQSDERMLKCKSGNLLCGECKADLAKGAKPFVAAFKKRREKAKDVIDRFMYDEKPFSK